MLEPSVKLVDKLTNEIIGFKYQYDIVEDVPYYIALSCEKARDLGLDVEVHKYYDIPEVMVVSAGHFFGEVSDVLFITEDYFRTYVEVGDKAYIMGYAFDKDRVIELDNEVILRRVN